MITTDPTATESLNVSKIMEKMHQQFKIFSKINYQALSQKKKKIGLRLVTRKDTTGQ